MYVQIRNSRESGGYEISACHRDVSKDIYTWITSKAPCIAQFPFFHYLAVKDSRTSNGIISSLSRFDDVITSEVVVCASV